MKENDERAKVQMKVYADTRARAKTSTIKVGDIVLARQRKHNKLSTRFDPVPFQVVRLKGTMVTARRNDKYITRNVSHFKVIDAEIQEDDEDEEEEDDLVSRPTSSSDTPDNNVSPPQNELRRSTRNRRQVDRFGQNIYGH